MSPINRFLPVFSAQSAGVRRRLTYHEIIISGRRLLASWQEERVGRGVMERNISLSIRSGQSLACSSHWCVEWLLALFAEECSETNDKIRRTSESQRKDSSWNGITKLVYLKKLRLSGVHSRPQEVQGDVRRSRT